MLDDVIGHDGVALMTASEIGDWYRAEMSKSQLVAADPSPIIRQR